MWWVLVVEVVDAVLILFCYVWYWSLRNVFPISSRPHLLVAEIHILTFSIYLWLVALLLGRLPLSCSLYHLLMYVLSYTLAAMYLVRIWILFFRYQLSREALERHRARSTTHSAADLLYFLSGVRSGAVRDRSGPAPPAMPPAPHNTALPRDSPQGERDTTLPYPSQHNLTLNCSGSQRNLTLNSSGSRSPSQVASNNLALDSGTAPSDPAAPGAITPRSREKPSPDSALERGPAKAQQFLSLSDLATPPYSTRSASLKIVQQTLDTDSDTSSAATLIHPPNATFRNTPNTNTNISVHGMSNASMRHDGADGHQLPQLANPNPHPNPHPNQHLSQHNNSEELLSHHAPSIHHNNNNHNNNHNNNNNNNSNSNNYLNGSAPNLHFPQHASSIHNDLSSPNLSIQDPSIHNDSADNHPSIHNSAAANEASLGNGSAAKLNCPQHDSSIHKGSAANMSNWSVAQLNFPQHPADELGAEDLACNTPRNKHNTQAHVEVEVLPGPVHPPLPARQFAQWFTRHKRLSQPLAWHLAIVMGPGVGFAQFVIVRAVYPAMLTAPSMWHDSCPNITNMALFLSSLVALLFLMLLAWVVREVKEALGVRREILGVMLLCTVSNIFMVCVRTRLSIAQELLGQTIVWFLMQIYICVYPIYLSLSAACTKPRAPCPNAKELPLYVTLCSDDLLLAFHAYARSMYALENLIFVERMMQLMKSLEQGLDSRSKSTLWYRLLAELMDEFVVEGSPQWVNLSQDRVVELECLQNDAHSRSISPEQTRAVLQPVLEEMYMLVLHDVYPRFLQSEIFQGFCRRNSDLLETLLEQPVSRDKRMAEGREDKSRSMEDENLTTIETAIQ
eukprot:g48203.t1